VIVTSYTHNGYSRCQHIPVGHVMIFSTVMPVVIIPLVFKLFTDISFIDFVIAITHNLIITVILLQIIYQRHNNQEYIYIFVLCKNRPHRKQNKKSPMTDTICGAASFYNTVGNDMRSRGRSSQGWGPRGLFSSSRTQNRGLGR